MYNAINNNKITNNSNNNRLMTKIKFAEAKRTRWKKGAFSFISWSTTFQEKFRTLSFIADLSIGGLAFSTGFYIPLKFQSKHVPGWLF